MNKKNKNLYPKRYTLNADSGIGLFEALVYVSIIALLTIIVINTAMVMSVTSGKARLKRNILGEGGVSLERIIREIRLADSVDVPGSVLGTHPGVLKLNTLVSASDDTPTTREFYLNSGMLMMKEGSAGAVPLTQNVNITRLVFYHVDMASTSKAVSVEMGAEDTVKKLTESHTFYTTSVMRRSY